MVNKTVAVINDSTVLSCSVITDPYHTVHWYWSVNHTVLITTSSNDDGREIQPDGGLHLSRVSKSDGGIYTCHIVSSGGNDSSSTQLYVLGTILTFQVYVLRYLEFFSSVLLIFSH